VILEYLYHNVESIQKLNIRIVAKNCFTSPATIVRLAKKMNLTGYSELVFKVKESCINDSTITQNTLSISEKEIKTFCQLLNDNSPNLITILSEGFSTHIASYISDVLNFHLISNISTPYISLIQNKNIKNSLFFIISHSGNEEILVERIDSILSNNNRIISFVGDRHSPLADKSTLTFSTDTFNPFSPVKSQPQYFFGETLIIFETLISEYLNLTKN